MTTNRFQGRCHSVTFLPTYFLKNRFSSKYTDVYSLEFLYLIYVLTWLFNLRTCVVRITFEYILNIFIRGNKSTVCRNDGTK